MSIRRSLLDFYPTTPAPLKKLELRECLKKYLILSTLAQEAFQNFIDRNFKLFDPLVGDNACHIRASKLLSIYQTKGMRRELKYIKIVLDINYRQIQRVLAKPYKPSSSKYSFKDYFNKKICEFKFEEPLCWILSSYLLTQVKEVKYELNHGGIVRGSEKVSTKSLVARGFQNTFSKNLIGHHQHFLAKESVSFIHSLTPFSSDLISSTIVRYKVRADKNHRMMTPFYSTGKLILEHMLSNNQTVIVKVALFHLGQLCPKESVTLKLAPEKGHYVPVKRTLKVRNEAVIFIEAISVSKDSLPTASRIKQKLTSSFEQIFKANFAGHRQFPAGIDEPNYNTDYLTDLNVAQVEGNMIENPTGIVFSHFYLGVTE